MQSEQGSSQSSMQDFLQGPWTLAELKIAHSSFVEACSKAAFVTEECSGIQTALKTVFQAALDGCQALQIWG